MHSGVRITEYGSPGQGSAGRDTRLIRYFFLCCSFLLVLFLVILPVAACPSVTGVSPSSGSTGGRLVQISGSGFLAATDVKFGTVHAFSYTIADDNTINAWYMNGTAGTTVHVTVADAGGTSAASPADRFTFAANKPQMDSVAPATGATAGGTTVVLSGKDAAGNPGGFGDVRSVKFGTVPATSYTLVDPGTINAVSPPQASGVVDITVVSAGGGTSTVSAADQFTYTAPVPSVTGVAPANGPEGGGTTVTITGTGFTAATAVRFGGTGATGYTVVSDTAISAILPPGSAGTVDVTVTTAGGTSPVVAADQFTYTYQPTVSSLSPSSGTTSGGTTVTITGTNLVSVTGVTFGGVPAVMFCEDSATTLQAQPAAAGAGTVDVRVVTSNGTSPVAAADRYTFVADPSATSATTVPTQTQAPGSDDGTGTPGAKGQAPAQPPAGTSTVDVNVGGNSAVSQVTVTGANVGSVVVTGTVVAGPPAGMPDSPGTVYQYLTLTPAGYTTITAADITFSVSESWLAGQHIDPANIALNRFAGGRWTTLPTTVQNRRNGFVFFTAKSPGFSYFAIIGISRSSTGNASGEPAVTTAVATGTPAATGTTREAAAPAATTVTAIPVPTPTPPAGASPLPMVLALVGIGGVLMVAIGIIIRRWWIRRQNPSLFEER